MKIILLKTLLVGLFVLINANAQALNEHTPRFSLNVGNMTTLSLSPSSTFGGDHGIALKPHPSNSTKYDQLAQLSDQKDENQNNSSVFEGTDPNKCSDSEFGLEFYCEPNWKWRRVEGAILIILTSKPMVTMTITKIDSPIKYLAQITDTYIRERGLYAEGFQSERVKFLNGEAVHVKAISQNFPDIRVSDYFFIQNNTLYGVLFSVKPKEEWDNYKFNIQKIIQSFNKLIL